MQRRKLLLVAAVLVAIVGTALVFLYVQGADTRAEKRFDTVEVLTAVATIEPGESIEDAAAGAKLAMQAVAQDAVLPNSQTSIEALSGLVATTAIYPGEQIITDKFGAADAVETDSALQIPKGMLAISVNLTDPARVAGFVNPGSEVAIFHSGQGLEPEDKPYTRLLLERVTVIGVGSTTPTTKTTTTSEGGETTEELPRTLLTLALNQRDAQKVMFAAANGNGELAFGLLTNQSTVKPDPGVTSTDLFR